MKAFAAIMTIATVAMSTQAFKFNLGSIYYPQSDNNTGSKFNFTVNANDSTPAFKNKTASAQEVRYLSSLLRGFIQGYRRGMYKESNYKVAKECFDDTTQVALESIFDSWNGYSIDWKGQGFNVMLAMKNIGDWCEYDEVLYDYMTYCFEGDMCEPSIMMGTLLKKIFQVTTVANDIAQLMNDGMPVKTDKTSSIQDYGEQWGSNIGKLLRYGTEFDPNMYNSFYDDY